MRYLTQFLGFVAVAAFVLAGTAYFSMYLPVEVDRAVEFNSGRYAAIDAEEQAHASTRPRDQIELKRYRVVFNSSVQVPYREPAIIKAEIASRSIAQALMSVKSGNGPVKEDDGEFTGYVRATLTGPSNYVTIDGDGSNSKMLSKIGNASWEWRVVPRTLRPIDLKLSFFNQIEKNGQVYELPGPAYYATIRVTPNWSARVEDWTDDNQGLLAILAILIPILTAGLGFLLGRWWEKRG